MELKDICVSLELAKELKENGWKTMTHFYYQKTDYRNEYYTLNIQDVNHALLRIKGGGDKGFVISAPTTDELLKVLPDYILVHNYTDCKNDGGEVGYIVYGRKDYNTDVYLHFHDKKLPNALAKMWLYLKKNNLLEENKQ